MVNFIKVATTKCSPNLILDMVMLEEGVSNLEVVVVTEGDQSFAIVTKALRWWEQAYSSYKAYTIFTQLAVEFTKDELMVMAGDINEGVLQLVIEVILFCVLAAVNQGINLNERNLEFSGLEMDCDNDWLPPDQCLGWLLAENNTDAMFMVICSGREQEGFTTADHFPTACPSHFTDSKDVETIMIKFT